MSNASSKTLVKNIALRTLALNVSSRNLTKGVSRRNFTGMVSKRDFGAVHVAGWRLWGQTDIYPFDTPTGVDSTKTFGDLP